GIVSNRQTLSRWIRYEGFPEGVLLGPNSRAWLEDGVLAWLESRRHTQHQKRPREASEVIARTAKNLSSELDRLKRDLPDDHTALRSVMRELTLLQPKLMQLLEK